MKRVLTILLALLLACAVPMAALGESTGRIYVSSTGEGTLNLRSGPGKEYEPKGYVHHNDRVTVLGHDGIWSKIKTASGRTGWIKTKYIDGTTRALGTGTKKVSVPDGGSLNLRKGPGTGYDIRGSVSNGATVKVLNTEDDWVKVTVTSSGRTGWIKAKYIGASASSGTGATSGAADPAKVYVRRVSGTSLNVRTGPGTGYSVVTSLNAGTPFKVRGSSGNWYEIATFGGIRGWVSKTYAADGANAWVTASSLNMRTKAGTSGKVQRSLAYGTQVRVDYLVGNWACVVLNGKTGFVSANYLRF